MALLCLTAIKTEDFRIFLRRRIIGNSEYDSPATGPAASVQKLPVADRHALRASPRLAQSNSLS